jgi:cyclophilin family peptidyl-prolyl cis-trans isomerase
VVFGRVIDGLDVIEKIENVPVSTTDRPFQPVKIEKCGIIPIEEFNKVLEQEETIIVPEEKKEKPKPKKHIPSSIPQPKKD